MSEFIITEDFPDNQQEFNERFSKEQACCEYLFRMRWPQGSHCPRCGHSGCWMSSRESRICCRWEYHQSIAAATIRHSTKKPVRAFFKPMWWFTTRKSGVNAVNLKDLLGLGSYHTKWRWLQNLRRCAIRKGRERLSGHVEVDEFYLGGESSGKRGRSVEHKCVIAVAVQQKRRNLGRLRLQIIDTCSAIELIPFIRSNFDPGSTIQTDGWGGYNGLATMGCTHEPMLQTKTEDKNSVLPGAHLVTSLIKRLIRGAFQGCFEQEYLARYLDEYVFRFNRRTTKSVGKRFWRFFHQLAASRLVTNTQLATTDISPLSPACQLSSLRIVDNQKKQKTQDNFFYYLMLPDDTCQQSIARHQPLALWIQPTPENVF